MCVMDRGPGVLSRATVVFFLICGIAALSAAFYVPTQDAATVVAQTPIQVSPTASPTATASPTLTVWPTPIASQTGTGPTNPTLIGAAIVGIIAAALMVGFYYTTRRM